jgi:hypothetical protein
MCVENKLVINWLNLNLSLAGPSWPLYIGGQVGVDGPVGNPKRKV